VEKEAVVADNTVLSNFALIGREDIFDKLFESDIIVTDRHFWQRRSRSFSKR